MNAILQIISSNTNHDDREYDWISEMSTDSSSTEQSISSSSLAEMFSVRSQQSWIIP